MKKYTLAVFAILACLLLSACSGGSGESSAGSSGAAAESTPAAKDIDIAAEANAFIEKYSLSGGLYYTAAGSAKLDEDLLRGYFGDATESPELSAFSDYALYIDETKPLKPCEFGIFRLNAGADKGVFMQFLRSRIDAKLLLSKAYPSMDTSMLKTAVFGSAGDYVWYAAVSDANEYIDTTLKEKLS